MTCPLAWFKRLSARRIRSLQPVVRIVEFGAALDTIDLAGPFAVFGQYIVDEPAMAAGVHEGHTASLLGGHAVHALLLII